jgi:hypothetical protein
VEWASYLLGIASVSNSTADDVCTLTSERSWESATVQNIEKPQDPIQSLLTIVATDIYDTFHVMSETLEQITQESLAESQLQERVNHRRALLTRLRKEIPLLTEGFEEFALAQKRPDISEWLEHLILSVNQRGNRVLGRLAQTSNDMRADMSLLESRRGIQEAESVTRLTELAFVFAPLTFVTSLFSMQVNELETGVPYTTVIIAGIVAITTLYSARILAYSETFQVVKHSFRRGRTEFLVISALIMQILRKTASMLLWGGGRVWRFYVAMTAMAIAVAPVVFLWRQSSLELGFKIVMSLIFIPGGCLLIYMTLTSFTEGLRWDMLSFMSRSREDASSYDSDENA